MTDKKGSAQTSSSADQPGLDGRDFVMADMREAGVGLVCDKCGFQTENEAEAEHHTDTNPRHWMSFDYMDLGS